MIPAMARTTRKTRSRKVKPRKGTHSSISDILVSSRSHRLVRKAARLHKIRLSWLDIVGQQLQEHCEPVDIKGKRLVVRAHGSAWMHEVQYFKADIVKRVTQLLPDLEVEKVTVTLAGPDADEGGA